MKFNLLLFLAIFILVGCESKNHVLFSKNQELTNIINNNQKSIYTDIVLRYLNNI